METRYGELKKDQEAMSSVLNEMMQRMELMTTQMKDMQTHAMFQLSEMQTQLSELDKRRDSGSVVLERGVPERPLSREVEVTSRGPVTFVMPKIEFPDFDGTNLEDWLYKCQRYFELEGVPEDKKVKLASLYMYGGALQWHFTYIRNGSAGTPLNWEEYAAALNRRFGAEVFEDPMGKMKNLKQEGKLDNLYSYMTEFDACLRRVLEKIDLPMQFQVSLFINGLKEEYWSTLWLLRPMDLLSAQANARILSQDAPLIETGRGTRPLRFTSRVAAREVGVREEPAVSTPTNIGNMNNAGLSGSSYRGGDSRGVAAGGDNRNAQQSRRRLTQEEIEDRRLKGLCFGCNEPFTRSHRCTKRQFFSLIVEEESEEGEESKKGGGNLDRLIGGDEEITVTMHAMRGEEGGTGVRTMKVEGQFRRMSLNVLINSGSTHNFLDSGVVKGVNLATVPIAPVRVMVADGRSIYCTTTLKRFEWEVQGHNFVADFYVIALGGCEMVLGVKWLAELGDITWNFQESVMRFIWKQREVKLVGNERVTDSKVLQLTAKERKIRRNVVQVFIRCWVEVRVGEPIELPPHCCVLDGNGEHMGWEEVLGSFEDIFQETKGLPPFRGHDHLIHLKEGVQGVNVRPYRHSASQKDVIERMIQELLSAGVIQPSITSRLS